MGLSLRWKDWRHALVVVHPDTVVHWQREQFRRWARLSNRSGRTGRLGISLEIRTLIRRLVEANPLWRAPRIDGELQKLGIDVSERTVSRALRILRRPPWQTWKTFLQNHLEEIVAVELTLSTIRLQVLFVFLVTSINGEEFFLSASRNIRLQGSLNKSWKLFWIAMIAQLTKLIFPLSGQIAQTLRNR